MSKLPFELCIQNQESNLPLEGGEILGRKKRIIDTYLINQLEIPTINFHGYARDHIGLENIAIYLGTSQVKEVCNKVFT